MAMAATSGAPSGRQYWSMVVVGVGRVAMDMICVDLGPNARDNAGRSVIIAYGVKVCRLNVSLK